jgi:amidase
MPRGLDHPNDQGCGECPNAGLYSWQGIAAPAQLLPVTQVPPFDVKQRYVTHIEGVPMETYIDWMKSCYCITATGLPAVSVPCGFTPEGLPVGLQIVGRHRDDLGVLQLAHAFEEATGFWEIRPPVVE